MKNNKRTNNNYTKDMKKVNETHIGLAIKIPTLRM